VKPKTSYYVAHLAAHAWPWPLIKCFARCFHSSVHIIRLCGCNLLDDVTSAGVDHIKLAACFGINPLVVDEELQEDVVAAAAAVDEAVAAAAAAAAPDSKFALK
jgi:hypothetical protein